MLLAYSIISQLPSVVTVPWRALQGWPPSAGSQKWETTVQSA